MKATREPVQISHDGFARQCVMRTRATDGECGECGSQGRRWAYWVEPDDRPNRSLNRAAAMLRVFCSVGCWRAYNS